MTEFLINDYVPDTSSYEQVIPDLLSPTDPSQSENVRDILNRFAITGISEGRDPSRDSFIGSLEEDEDISSERVNNLLESPDLSMMDEMEIQDYIRDNVSFTDDSPGQQSESPMEPAPPADPPPAAE